jgi:hypothetical protein
MSYVQAGAVAGSFPVGGTGSASKIDTGAANPRQAAPGSANYNQAAVLLEQGRGLIVLFR